jgi:hypothetical protein
MENILENELARLKGYIFSERKTTQIWAFFFNEINIFAIYITTSSSPCITQGRF